MPFTAEMPVRKSYEAPCPITDAVPQRTTEEELNGLPDKVADALGMWRFKTADKRREAARLLLSFKAMNAGKNITMTELKAMVDNDTGYYQICLDEIMEESRYKRLYEKLMAAKKMAAMRTAF